MWKIVPGKPLPPLTFLRFKQLRFTFKLIHENDQRDVVLVAFKVAFDPRTESTLLCNQPRLFQELSLCTRLYGLPILEMATGRSPRARSKRALPPAKQDFALLLQQDKHTDAGNFKIG